LICLGPGLICWAVPALCRGDAAPVTLPHVHHLARVPMRTMGCVTPCRLALRLTRAHQRGRAHLGVFAAAVPAAAPAASAAVLTAGARARGSASARGRARARTRGRARGRARARARASRGVEHARFTQTCSLPYEGNAADISVGDIAQDRNRRDQGLDAGIRGLCLYTSCPACRIFTALEVQECLNCRLCRDQLLAGVFGQRVGIHPSLKL
jgi:hypothetical protein